MSARIELLLRIAAQGTARNCRWKRTRRIQHLGARHPIRMMPCDRRSENIKVVGCVLALLALISPRLVLFLLWIFSSLLSRAFDSWVIPFLGFFLLPWTTLAYAAFWDWGPGHHVTGFEWFFVVLAFFIDVSSYAGGQRARSRRA
ncbi:MAG TPA: hypothetical protein VLP43_02840 [Solirubrobacteraceae bacterium]|nr:hypothetical protein [Solirubrobacteraceae bacterium]